MTKTFYFSSNSNLFTKTRKNSHLFIFFQFLKISTQKTRQERKISLLTKNVKNALFSQNAFLFFFVAFLWWLKKFACFFQSLLAFLLIFGEFVMFFAEFVMFLAEFVMFGRRRAFFEGIQWKTEVIWGILVFLERGKFF
jgi:hypothetical protein